MQFLKSIPIQLVFVIGIVILFGQWIPFGIVKGLYTFSLLFKELLGLILPFMVFFFVLAGILSFKRNAPLILAILLVSIFCSNALVSLISYGAVQLLSSNISCEPISDIIPTYASIEPFFSITLPSLINALHALIAAIVLGLLFSFMPSITVQNGVLRIKEWIEALLKYGFIPFLPLYIFGFLLKIRYEGMLACVMRQYGTAFLLIVSLQYIYIFWLYFVAAGFSIRRTLESIKNALPSYITAFSTMSSTIAIPLSVQGAEKNTGNKELAQVAMPIMANVHLLGDSFVTPILALVTMLVFQGILPPISHYIVFVFYFCIAMFAASGIPGGGILVMIPILKSELNFSAQMISVVMTIYFLLDSFGTGANVMGDGALVIIINKWLKRFGLVH